MRNLLCILGLIAATALSAQTNVQGGIYSNTTWTLANSPYVMTGSIVVVGLGAGGVGAATWPPSSNGPPEAGASVAGGADCGLVG